VIFLIRPQKAWTKKAKLDRRDYIKIRSCCTIKEIIKNHRQPTELKKMSASHPFGEGLTSIIVKEPKKLKSKITNSSIKKQANDFNRYFTKKYL
jgi:hypothetical protein